MAASSRGPDDFAVEHCVQRMMAFELAIIGIVVGIVLGLRYKVLILAPAVLFVIVLAIVIGVARADSAWSIVLMTIVAVTAVQLGYLAGIVIRATIGVIFPPRKEDHNSEPDPNSGTDIGFAWRHIWPLDGWAECGSIMNLHQLPPPQV